MGHRDASSSLNELRKKSYAFRRLQTSLAALASPGNTPVTPQIPLSMPRERCPSPHLLPTLHGGGKGLSPRPHRRRVSYFLLAAVDLPLLLRRQRKHGLSVLVREVKFILERGKKPHKTCNMSTQTGDGTDTTPQISIVNQRGATPQRSGGPAASPRDYRFVRAMMLILILLFLTSP